MIVRHPLFCLGVCILLCTLVLIPEGNSQQGSNFITWKDGFHINAKNGVYHGRIGGRILLDFVGFDQHSYLETEYGKLDAAYEWRRLRAYHSGSFHNFKYKMQFEFSGQHMMIEDLYLEYGDVPFVGNVKVGHMKEPFLLEMLSSSKHVVFMERAVTTIFSSGRNLGLLFHNRIPESDLYWSVGAFRNGLFDIVGKSEHFGYNFTGRFSGLILRNEERTRFFHAGIGVKHSTYENSTLQISSRPESHLAHKYATTGTLEGIRHSTAVSTDLVLQAERFSVQAEVVNSRIALENSTADLTHRHFSSYMAQASFFLTKDARNYINGNSGFGKIDPNRKFSDGGIGAVELAARISRLDLRSGTGKGQEMNNITLGLNWYPNVLTRISTNYIRCHVVDMGHANIFETRLQIAI